MKARLPWNLICTTLGVVAAHACCLGVLLYASGEQRAPQSAEVGFAVGVESSGGSAFGSAKAIATAPEQEAPQPPPPEPVKTPEIAPVAAPAVDNPDSIKVQRKPPEQKVDARKTRSEKSLAKREQPKKKAVKKSEAKASSQPVVRTGDERHGGGAVDHKDSSAGFGIHGASGAAGAGSSSTPGAGGGAGDGPASDRNKALVLRRVEPEYPMRARRRHIEGVVTLTVEVRTDGRPGLVAVQKSSGSEALDTAAVAAMRQWLFAPYREQGVAKDRTYSIDVVFRLNN